MAVERLFAKDYEDFLDFIDQVFSQDLIRVHFQEDLPLLFKPDDEHMQMQYAYRDERGRFRAAIGCIPYTYKIGDEEFKTWTITNVATHYRYTGRGYMQTIFKKVFEDSIFLSDLTKINSGVEVNRTEHVVKLRTVVLFNIGKSDIDLLTDGGIVSIFVEVIKCRGLVHNKALAAHSTCNSFFVAVVLLAVLLSCICVNVAQILYKKHRQYIIFIPSFFAKSASISFVCFVLFLKNTHFFFYRTNHSCRNTILVSKRTSKGK